MCARVLNLVVHEYWLYTCYIELACAENCNLKIWTVQADSVSGYVSTGCPVGDYNSMLHSFFFFVLKNSRILKILLCFYYLIFVVD